MASKKQWFETWFSTPYYDLLYRHRNEDEAAAFLDALTGMLHPQPGAAMLDVACGKGRHAIYLAEKGFEVTGIDLSYKNIAEAKKEENERLSFFQHDMRKLFRVNYFDFIFNFYTSFGYFASDAEDLQCIKAFAAGLRPGGKLVIDFFNVKYILQQLVEDESKMIDGIGYTISKSFVDGFVIKNIAVNDHGNIFQFSEKVKAISLKQFEQLFTLAGLRLVATFGNYRLDPFDAATSERLILMAEK